MSVNTTSRHPAFTCQPKAKQSSIGMDCRVARFRYRYGATPRNDEKHKGFTLIELSIVLVIIGLIVSGVLVGKDLIKAAEMRSLVSQMNQFKTMANTFRLKYGALPGDIHPNQTSKLNMFTFTGTQAGKYGHGDNDGLIVAAVEQYCFWECGAFWRHLSDASIISGSYGSTLVADTTGSGAGVPAGESAGTPFTLSKYMPVSKGVSGYVGAGGIAGSAMNNNNGLNTSLNLFWVTSAARADRASYAEPILSAIDAYSIDTKIDNGFPNSGKVMVSTYEDYDSYDFYYWSNGTTDYDGSPLNTNSKVCTIGGVDATAATGVQYNTNPGTGGTNITCIPLFVW